MLASACLPEQQTEAPVVVGRRAQAVSVPFDMLELDFQRRCQRMFSSSNLVLMLHLRQEKVRHLF